MDRYRWSGTWQLLSKVPVYRPYWKQANARVAVEAPALHCRGSDTCARCTYGTLAQGNRWRSRCRKIVSSGSNTRRWTVNAKCFGGNYRRLHGPLWAPVFHGALAQPNRPTIGRTELRSGP